MKMVCKGCVALFTNNTTVFECNDYSRPYYIKNKIKVHCPCIKCLIKGICQNTCDDFERHVVEIRSRWKKSDGKNINKWTLYEDG